MLRIFGLVLAIGLFAQSSSGALLTSYRFQTAGTTPPNTVGTQSPSYDGVLTNEQINAGSFVNSPTSGTANGVTGGTLPLNSPAQAGDKYWATNLNGTVNTSFQTVRFNQISITNPGTINQITIEKLNLKAWKGNGTKGTGYISVQYSINDGAWNRWVTSGTSNPVGTFSADSAFSVSGASTTGKPTVGTDLVATSPIVLGAGENVKIRFIYNRVDGGGTTGTNLSRIFLDDLEVHGSFRLSAVPEPLSVATFGLVGAGLFVARRRKKA